MILIISCIVLVVGFFIMLIASNYDQNWAMNLGGLMIVGAIVVGFMFSACVIPVRTVQTMIPRAQATIVKTPHDVLVETSRQTDNLTTIDDYNAAEQATAVVYYDDYNSYGVLVQTYAHLTTDKIK